MQQTMERDMQRTIKVKSIKRKHVAKLREERERSHYVEWEQDLIRWLEQNGGKDGSYVCTTQTKLRQELGISNGTLNNLFKCMTKVKKVSVAGRLGMTYLCVIPQSKP